MIQEVLLSNENYIRSVTLIDNNLQSKFLLSALREAQDVGLQQIIGTTMLKKLKNLVWEKKIDYDSNSAYKNLLDECQLYLAYQTISNLCLVTNVKISNGGLQQTTDENLTTLSVADTFIIKEQYQGKADFYAKRLQQYILDNKKDLPEISENKCHDIHAELHSAATTSVWLGGKRSPVSGWVNNRYRKY